MIIVNFIRDKEVGIYARAKRLAKSQSVQTAKIVPGSACVSDMSDSEEESSASVASDKSE